ncbi:MAG: hypothetical protein H0V40_05740 [Actinobacteria bacterium]|nr:hypothetical protein [Actinomycetota bacterium]
MSEAGVEMGYEVDCPHCRKAFLGTLLAGTAARYRGFKCPHCRLFVPLERVESAVKHAGAAPAA